MDKMYVLMVCNVYLLKIVFTNWNIVDIQSASFKIQTLVFIEHQIILK